MPLVCRLTRARSRGTFAASQMGQSKQRMVKDTVQSINEIITYLLFFKEKKKRSVYSVLFASTNKWPLFLAPQPGAIYSIDDRFIALLCVLSVIWLILIPKHVNIYVLVAFHAHSIPHDH